MKKKRKKLIFDIIKIITLTFPMITYLILSATILNIEVDHFVGVENIEVIKVVKREDSAFVYSLDNEVEYEGTIIYDKEYEAFGVLLKPEEIVKINNKFYSYTYQDNGSLEYEELNPYKLKQKTSWALPMGIFFSLIGLLFVIGLISGKLKFSRRYRELSLLITLGVTTLMLYFINLFIHSLFYVFLIAFISYGLYYIEHVIYLNLDKDAKKEAKKNDTILKLDSIIRNL